MGAHLHQMRYQVEPVKVRGERRAVAGQAEGGFDRRHRRDEFGIEAGAHLRPDAQAGRRRCAE